MSKYRFSRNRKFFFKLLNPYVLDSLGCYFHDGNFNADVWLRYRYLHHRLYGFFPEADLMPYFDGLGKLVSFRYATAYSRLVRSLYHSRVRLRAPMSDADKKEVQEMTDEFWSTHFICL